MAKQIIKLGVASKNQNSQCNCVYDISGLFPTLCGGVHGYASGYILVRYDNENNREIIKK